MSFFQSLSSNTNQVLLYEEEDLQEIARSSIPMDTLQKKADKEFNKLKNTDPSLTQRDCLLLELLAWFKS